MNSGTESKDPPDAGSSASVAMAKRNYFVEGLSGVGKSSVYGELIKRG